MFCIYCALLTILVIANNPQAEIFSIESAENNTQNLSKMPEKRIAPVISKLEEFEMKLEGFLDSKKIISLLLDYDGTLAPITDNPNNTAMPAEIETMLNSLARNPKIFMAVISGRGLEDIKKKIGIKGITYSGNHGIEIEKPDGSRLDYQLPEDVQKSYKSLVKELNDKVYKENAWVEDKKVSLTFHYRDTPKDVVKQLKKTAVDIIESHGFTANQAHEAVEAKPPINWNKGEAALFILKNKFGEDWASKTSVVFAGDDTTDEDAMRALQGTGKSFRISTDPKIMTYADYRLPTQSVTTDFLKWISNVYD